MQTTATTATIPSQNTYEPSVVELLFLLSESTKLVRYTEETSLRIKETLLDSVARIVGLHAKHVSGAVRLDRRPKHDPTLLVSSDDPAFFDHVNKTIALLQNLARAADNIGSDPDATNAARNELISYILHHSLGPHAAEYSLLRDMLQHDLDADLIKDTTRDPTEGAGTKWLREEAEAWCTGLTCALNVLNNAPDSDASAVLATTSGSTINTEEVDSFWDWARRRYMWLLRMENVYYHVIKYSELPSAADLLRYVNHILKAIVFPLLAFANPENKRSNFTWLHNLTTQRLDKSGSKPPSSNPASPDIDPERLEKWLFALICNPPLTGAHSVSREVARSLIGASGSESLREKWKSYVEHEAVHPEATHLIDIINTANLAASISPVADSDSDGLARRRRTRRSLVARADGSCLACTAAYEATRQAYGLELRDLCVFPTEGDSTPGPAWDGSNGHWAPCRMPPLPTAVEEKFKGVLVEKIKAVVRAAIMERRRATIVRPLRVATALKQAATEESSPRDRTRLGGAGFTGRMEDIVLEECPTFEL